MSDVAVGPGPSGINGWLLLPALGLILSPLQGVLGVVDTLQLLPFTEGWPEARTLMFVEAFVFAAIGIFSIYVAIQFFRRKQATPTLFIALMAGAIAIAFGISIVEGLVLDLPLIDVEALPRLAVALIAAAIWITYFRVSVRVRNTFTQP